jgi:hypothetical protein
MAKAHRYVPALLLAVGVAVATQACAARTYGYPGGGYGGYGRDLERRAYENGYREGVEEGQNDARHNRDFSYQRHNEYRDADGGFHRSDGDINLYRRSFRSGFQTGYSESYNRNARYNSPRVVVPVYPAGPPNSYPSNRGGFRSPAADNGYRDGIEAGRNDARDRGRFDPIRAKRYREGDHDYDNHYGSRDEYKREYRAAFEQGYRQGYGAARR